MTPFARETQPGDLAYYVILLSKAINPTKADAKKAQQISWRPCWKSSF
jgi:hypothetical protein